MNDFQKRIRADLRNRDEISRKPNQKRIPFAVSRVLTETLPPPATRLFLCAIGAESVETEWSLDAHGTITFSNKESK